MQYLLDTTIFSALMWGNAAVAKRVAELSAVDKISICSIVRGEVLHGLQRLADGKKRQTLTARANLHFADFDCLAIRSEIADQYAAIKTDCERRGRPVADNDLWIAATALQLGATLVSRDRGFSHVQGLSVEDWTQ